MAPLGLQKMNARKAANRSAVAAKGMASVPRAAQTARSTPASGAAPDCAIVVVWHR